MLAQRERGSCLRTEKEDAGRYLICPSLGPPTKHGKKKRASHEEFVFFFRQTHSQFVQAGAETVSVNANIITQHMYTTQLALFHISFD